MSRLIPSFEGKSYGTTMAQVSGEMVGMTLSQSIKHMELELEAMEPHDGDRRALKGVLLANMSLKQSIKLIGKEKTMASARLRCSKYIGVNCLSPNTTVNSRRSRSRGW